MTVSRIRKVSVQEKQKRPPPDQRQAANAVCRRVTLTRPVRVTIAFDVDEPNDQQLIDPRKIEAIGGERADGRVRDHGVDMRRAYCWFIERSV